MDLHQIKVVGNCVSAFVEGRVEGEVVVGFRNEAVQLKHDLAQIGYADGSEFASLFCRQDSGLLDTPLDDPERTAAFTGTTISEDLEKRLVLVPLNVTENDKRACRNAQILNGIGTIRFTLGWGKAEMGPAGKYVYPKGPRDRTPIARAFAMEHNLTERAGLKGQRAVETQARHYWTDYDGGVPFAEFKFHYRNKDMLQRMCILPAPARAPSLAPPCSTGSSSSAHTRSGEVGGGKAKRGERLINELRRDPELAGQLRELMAGEPPAKRQRSLSRGVSGSPDGVVDGQVPAPC